MDVTIFNSRDGQHIVRLEQINENQIVGGGRFTTSNIDELFELMAFDVVKLKDYIWVLPKASIGVFISKSDEQIMQLGADWSDCESWRNVSVNPMDLSGHLLEIKHNYLSQAVQESLWILFE